MKFKNFLGCNASINCPISNTTRKSLNHLVQNRWKQTTKEYNTQGTKMLRNYCLWKDMIAYSVHASLEHNQVPIFWLKNWGILGVRRNASKMYSLRPATLLKKRGVDTCVSHKFCEIVKNTFLKEQLWWLLLHIHILYLFVQSITLYSLVISTE